MAEVGNEAELALDRRNDGRGIAGIELPRTAAIPALKVSVLGFGQDVELLPSRCGVAVADVAELFEDVEGPVDR